MISTLSPGGSRVADLGITGLAMIEEIGDHRRPARGETAAPAGEERVRR
jgi:hypothetical protein